MKWFAVAALAVASTAAADPSFRGQGVVGVWMGSSAGELKLEWRVVFDSGQVLRGLPTAGLADLVPGKPTAGAVWGTWKPDGTAAYGAAHERLARDGDDLAVDRAAFARAIDIDGVKLAATYSPRPPDEPAEAGATCAPMIAFAADGTFVDHGVFVTSCASPAASPALAPGSGTYEARDFTLILRYRDGHVVRRAFTGAPRKDPRKDDAAIFVGGQAWRKRVAAAPGPAARPGAFASPVPLTVARPAEVQFDVVAFAPPPGKETRLPTTIGYTANDPATRTFCSTSIFNSVPAGATPEEDFAAEWKDTIGHLYKVTPDPGHTAGTTASGLAYLLGASPAVKGDKTWYGQLFVFSLGGRRLSILVMSSSAEAAPGCLTQIAPMLASLRRR